MRIARLLGSAHGDRAGRLVFMHALFSRSPVSRDPGGRRRARGVGALRFGSAQFHPAAEVTAGPVTTGPYRLSGIDLCGACVFAGQESWLFCVMPLAAGVLLLIGAVIRVFAERFSLSVTRVSKLCKARADGALFVLTPYLFYLLRVNNG